MTASSGLDPETITTAIQLDALPVGSVVRSGDGQIWQRVYRKWDCLSENGEGGTYESETVIWQTRPPVATLLYRPDRPSEDRFHDIAHAVTEAYAPEGQSIWWRAWAMHPDQRAQMEAGVLAAWSGQSTDGTDPVAPEVDAARLRSGIEALADEWERQREFAKADAPGYAMLLRDHADHLRALLSEVSA